MKKITSFLCVYFLVCSITSCKGVYPYADKYTDVRWISTEPKIEFTYLKDSQGVGFGTIEGNDSCHNAVFVWGMELFIDFHNI